MSENITSITKHSSLFFVGKLLDAVIMFIINIIAARVLGASNYGTYVYIFTIVMLISIFIKLGMDQGLSAVIPRYNNKDIEKNLISFSLITLYAISIVVIIFALVFSTFISEALLNNIEYKTLLIKFIPLLLLLPLSQISEGIFRTIGEIKHFIIAKNIIVPVGIIVALVFQTFILKQKTVEMLLYSNYLAWILSAAYIFGVLMKKGYIVMPRLIYIKIYKNMLLVSLPLIFVGLLDYLMGRVDSFMLGYMMDPEAVALYNIADKVAYITSFLFIAASSITAPIISRIYHEKDYKKLHSLYSQVTKWIIIVNTAVFFIIFLNSREITMIFGEEYLSADNTLIALSFSYLVNASVGPVIYMNAMTGREKQEFNISVFMLIGNIILNYTLIKTYGVMGSAISTIIVFAVANIARLIILKKNLDILPFNLKYNSVIINGLITFIPIFYLKKTFNIESYLLRLLVYSFIYGLIYIILIWSISLQQDEKRTVKYYFNKLFNKA